MLSHLLSIVPYFGLFNRRKKYFVVIVIYWFFELHWCCSFFLFSWLVTFIPLFFNNYLSLVYPHTSSPAFSISTSSRVRGFKTSVIKGEDIFSWQISRHNPPPPPPRVPREDGRVQSCAPVAKGLNFLNLNFKSDCVETIWWVGERERKKTGGRCFFFLDWRLVEYCDFWHYLEELKYYRRGCEGYLGIGIFFCKLVMIFHILIMISVKWRFQWSILGMELILQRCILPSLERCKHCKEARQRDTREFSYRM